MEANKNYTGVRFLFTTSLPRLFFSKKLVTPVNLFSKLKHSRAGESNIYYGY